MKIRLFAEHIPEDEKITSELTELREMRSGTVQFDYDEAKTSERALLDDRYHAVRITAEFKDGKLLTVQIEKYEAVFSIDKKGVEYVAKAITTSQQVFATQASGKVGRFVDVDNFADSQSSKVYIKDVSELGVELPGSEQIQQPHIQDPYHATKVLINGIRERHVDIAPDINIFSNITQRKVHFLEPVSAN